MVVNVLVETADKSAPAARKPPAVIVAVEDLWSNWMQRLWRRLERTVTDLHGYTAVCRCRWRCSPTSSTDPDVRRSQSSSAKRSSSSRHTTDEINAALMSAVASLELEVVVDVFTEGDHIEGIHPELLEIIVIINYNLFTTSAITRWLCTSEAATKDGEPRNRSKVSGKLGTFAGQTSEAPGTVDADRQGRGVAAGRASPISATGDG